MSFSSLPLRIDQIVFCVVFISLIGVWPFNGKVFSAQSLEHFENTQLEPIAPVPVKKEAANYAVLTKTLSAEVAYVTDLNSGVVLLTKNEHTKHSPASTTKLMTALVARDVYDLDEVLTVREETFTQGNVIGLQIGEKISVENLLRGLLIQSGNDAAFVLANNHPEGYQGFVQAMNDKAQQLHLSVHTFSNPSGLDQDAHLTTARDLTLIAREVLKDDVLREVVATKSTVITDQTGITSHSLFNTNELLGDVEGVKGVKTGTTAQAGQSLITYVDREGNGILITILGSQDRYADTRSIIDWVYATYDWVEWETIK